VSHTGGIALPTCGVLRDETSPPGYRRGSTDTVAESVDPHFASLGDPSGAPWIMLRRNTSYKIYCVRDVSGGTRSPPPSDRRVQDV
jgi:hypothetical protein